jgi:Xaa-Pro aminopeptidase
VTRLDRLRAAMASAGVDALVAGPSADYRWLTGLHPPLPTRLTLAIVPRDGAPAIVTPGFEAAVADGFAVDTWDDGDDPLPLVVRHLAGARRIAVSDRTWSRYALQLQASLPSAMLVGAGPILEPLRSVKDAAELDALRAVGAAVDRTLGALQSLAWAGRTERAVARDIAEALLECGHDHVHDVIVGSGPNGAMPHHDASDRRIEVGDAVVVDIGGELGGYVSDVTRMVVVGQPPPGFEAVHAAVDAAHEAGRRAAVAGATTGAVDAAARAVLDAAGYGANFTHRLGHGIGLDTHEAPYLAPGSTTELVEGMAFTIEPGVYLAGRFGVRIEDTYLLGAASPVPVTNHPHTAILVD